MSDDDEQLLEKAGNMKEIRAVAGKHPGFREAVTDSVASSKVCLTQVLSRLKLKDDGFSVFNAAAQEAMDQCLTALKEVEDTI